MSVLQPPSTHPDWDTWRAYFADELELGVDAELTDHLATCPRCCEVVAKLPPPVLRCLGRPMSCPIEWTPNQIEEWVQRFLTELSGAVGRTWVLTGPLSRQSLLYHLIGIVAARLRRRGQSVNIATPALEPAARPGAARFEILVDAEAAAAPEAWRRAVSPSQTLLLCCDLGSVEQFTPDQVWQPEPEPRRDEAVRVERLLDAYRNGGAAARRVLVATALGRGLTGSACEGCQPEDFVARLAGPAGDLTEWWTAPDSWLVREAVRRVAEKTPGSYEEARRSLAGAIPA